MAIIAKNKILSSKGEILAGAKVPSLPKAEMALLQKAGALVNVADEVVEEEAPAKKSAKKTEDKNVPDNDTNDTLNLENADTKIGDTENGATDGKNVNNPDSQTAGD